MLGKRKHPPAEPAGRSPQSAGAPCSDEVGFQERLKALVEASNELATMRSTEELCRRAVELARGRLGLDRVSIWFCGEQPNEIVGSFGTDERGGLRDERSRRIAVSDAEYIEDVLQCAKSAVVRREGDLHDDSRHVVGKGSWICAGMWDSEKVIGYVFADNLLRRAPITEQDCEILALFASAVAHLCSLKRTEVALRHSESEHRATLDAMADAVHVVDRDLRILLINERFKLWITTLGLEANVVGRKVFEVFPFLPDSVRDEYRKVFETGEPLATEEVSRVGGRELITDTRKIPIVEDGKVVRVVTSVRDVTESRRAEEALQESRTQFLQAQKMEALGRLAGGVAHDFNNLLTTIIGYGRLVLDRMGRGDPVYEDIEEIVHAGERAVDLTSQLLSFGRSKVGHPRPVNLNTVVTETDRLLRRTLGEDIEVVTMLGDHLGGVMADPSQLQQVLMNLAINSRDAMPGGGKLAIETARVDLDEPFCAARPGLKPGPHVKLSVKDNGTGMSDKVRQHIFEPFFTTKPKGKGSGLGLATVYGIVKQSQGWIDVDSEEGRGTTITIYLPRQEEMSAEILPPRRGPELPRGTETILVVEDEESVRHFTVKILETLGYRVLQAGNGGEALLVFELEKGPIDLVLTDVVMPLMNGRELVRRLKESGQAFKVLYTTGFSEDVFADRETDAANIPLLQKPYTREVLGRMVRQILDNPQPA
ncbi:MAG: response regulator [Kiritimatiellae bacterium]|nr:response regulator [Kiritimatiellia bacterium]